MKSSIHFPLRLLNSHHTKLYSFYENELNSPLHMNEPSLPIKRNRLNTNLSQHFSQSDFKLSCSNDFSQSSFDANKKKIDGMQESFFCFGLGYTGLNLIQQLKLSNWKVGGTCRDNEKSIRLNKQGMNSFLFNNENSNFDSNFNLSNDGIDFLTSSTHLLITIPPDMNLKCDLVLKCQEENLVIAAKKSLKWIGYLSTTSVYGNWNGDWVDESYETRAKDEKSKIRIECEKQWIRFGNSLGIKVVIFRLGGVYGYGRSIFDSLLSNSPESPNQIRRKKKKYTSRCHVADISQTIQSTMQTNHIKNKEIFNIVDDDPASRNEVLNYAEFLLHHLHNFGSVDNVSEQDYASWGRSNITSELGLDEKRVSNRKIKKVLGVDLMHPNYKSGLRSILKLQNSQRI